MLVDLPAQHFKTISQDHGNKGTRQHRGVSSSRVQQRQLPRDSYHEDPIKIKHRFCDDMHQLQPNMQQHEKLTLAHFTSPKHNFSSIHVKHRTKKKTKNVHLINDLPLCSARPSTWLQCFPAKNDLVPTINTSLFFKVHTLRQINGF